MIFVAPISIARVRHANISTDYWKYEIWISFSTFSFIKDARKEGTRNVIDNIDYDKCSDLTSLHLWLSSWLCRGHDGGGQTTKPPPLEHMINPH